MPSKKEIASNNRKLLLEIASCLEAAGSMDYFNATLIFRCALKELHHLPSLPWQTKILVQLYLPVDFKLLCRVLRGSWGGSWPGPLLNDKEVCFVPSASLGSRVLFHFEHDVDLFIAAKNEGWIWGRGAWIILVTGQLVFISWGGWVAALQSHTWAIIRGPTLTHCYTLIRYWGLLT